MAKTAFISRSSAGNASHNAREFNADHPEPGYLLPLAHRRENVHILTGLTPEKVRAEYLVTTDFGQKHGRLHHKARPVREAVIVCQESTGEADVRRLMAALETGLDIRCMNAHLHRDEGYLDKATGAPVYNFHIHLGYTNLVDGKLTHINQERMRKAQDLCAEVLGMDRGDPVEKTGHVHLPHQQYRRAAKEKAQAIEQAVAGPTVQARAGQDQIARLIEENRRLREALKATEAATQNDYQALKQAKDDEKKSFEDKIAAMRRVLDNVTTRAATAEKERDTEKTAYLDARQQHNSVVDKHNALLDQYRGLKEKHNNLVALCRPFLKALDSLPHTLHEKFCAAVTHVADRLGQRARPTPGPAPGR